MNRRGLTLFEVMFGIAAVAALLLFAGMVFVGAHFIAKVW